MTRKLTFYTLLHCSEKNKTNSFILSDLDYIERIKVYLACCKLLNDSLEQIAGQHLVILTNNGKLLKTINPGLDYKELTFEMDMPEGGAWYSAHFKLECFKYFASLSENEYSILLDSDEICINKMPEPLTYFVETGIPLLSGYYSFFGQNQINNYNDKKILLEESFNFEKCGYWWGGFGFYGGLPSFFNDFFAVCQTLLASYKIVYNKIKHHSDDLIVSCAWEWWFFNGKPSIYDVSDLGIVSTVWPFNFQLAWRPISFYKNHFLLHMPADKTWMAGYEDSKDGNILNIHDDVLSYLEKTLRQKNIVQKVFNRIKKACLPIKKGIRKNRE
jgi:hypothetical protein